MQLTFQDILITAVLSFFITVLILQYKKLFITRKLNHKGKKTDYKNLEKRCYLLFPFDSIIFNGRTVFRGMQVRIITKSQKTIEGKFIGTNKDNILCILTKNYVVAQGVKNIEEINLIKE